MIRFGRMPPAVSTTSGNELDRTTTQQHGDHDGTPCVRGSSMSSLAPPCIALKNYSAGCAGLSSREGFAAEIVGISRAVAVFRGAVSSQDMLCASTKQSAISQATCYDTGKVSQASDGTRQSAVCCIVGRCAQNTHSAHCAHGACQS